MLNHLTNLYEFYGEYMGIRIARKHIGWYMKYQPEGVAFSAIFNTLENAEQQQELILRYFSERDENTKAA